MNPSNLIFVTPDQVFLPAQSSFIKHMVPASALHESTQIAPTPVILTLS